jgi:phosphatidyl-myo-inositol dimannoside synthase
MGGIQRYNRQLISSWKKIFPKHHLKVFAYEDETHQNKETKADTWVEGCRLKIGVLRRTEFFFKALLAIFVCRPRLIVAGHIRYAFIAYLLAKVSRSRYVIIIHGQEATQPKSFFLTLGLTSADSIWSVSRFTAQCCAEANGIEKAKFSLLPNSANEEWFSPGPVPQEFKNKYGIEEQKILLTVSRMDSREKHKGIDTTLVAIPRILNVVPDLLYFVVGSGDDQERLVNLSQQLKVEKFVKFAGQCSDSDLLNFYRSANCYVMPSTEGFGIVYLESLLVGVPVIAGDKDGSEEPLQDGRLGWRVNKTSPDDIANACIVALSGSDSRCRASWLREETAKKFGTRAFEQNLINTLSLLMGFQ